MAGPKLFVITEFDCIDIKIYSNMFKYYIYFLITNVLFKIEHKFKINCFLPKSDVVNTAACIFQI